MKFFSKLNLTKYFTKREILGAFFVGALFLAALFVSYQYSEVIENLVVFAGPLGMILYFTLAVASVVLAPMAALPFLPIGVKLWGSLATALLSVSGWTVGAIIAFVLAEKYGRPFVSKIISLERAEAISKRLVGKNSFWLIVLSRVILPTDIISYAIGLFVPIKLGPYTLATLLGTIPLAFTISYGVTLTPRVQTIILIGLIVAAIISVAIFWLYLRNKKRLPRQGER